MPYYFVLLGLVALVITMLGWYQVEAKRTRNTALRLLDELDMGYEDFIQKRLKLAFLQDDSWQDKREILVGEAQEILKPTLDALATLVSSTRHMSIALPMDSPFFKNIAALSEAGFNTSSQPEGIDAQKQILYAAVQDAIKADLSHRWLDEQTGERLTP